MLIPTSSSSGFRYTGLAIVIVVLVGIAVLSLPSIVLSWEPQVLSQAGCCSRGSGSGGPQGNQTAPQLSKTDVAIKAAIAYYQQKYGDSSVSATATDYGCHVEVTILNDGQPVKTLTYLNGQIYE